jgi:hypothetical protein
MMPRDGALEQRPQNPAEAPAVQVDLRAIIGDLHVEARIYREHLQIAQQIINKLEDEKKGLQDEVNRLKAELVARDVMNPPEVPSEPNGRTTKGTDQLARAQ